MAVYKVPQDVEADDKLIGPFSFRQFIYLIIVAISIAIGWGLSRLFIPLAIIPLPIVVLFGALALPLKKDQPMEIYLAAVVSFYLKPRRRLWQPDGIQSLVEITAPKVIEIKRAKDLSETEAQQRLSYLANIVDTEGWAVRGIDTNSAMQNDAYYEAQQQEDVLDASSGVAQSFDSMINQSDVRRRQDMIERMRQTTQAPTPTVPIIAAPTVDPYANLTPTAPTTDEPRLTYNPYPTSIHQSVINPLGTKPQPEQPAPVVATIQPSIPTVLAPQAPPIETTTSETIVSPDIINLANNSDLSIETIAHEANRIHQKEEKLPEEEVVISLR
ncbi:MAG TPA: PrgI family protein [Candidatus Chromulinivoraceae bacterium]|nr:PrgI family protein [Candidatus Chromulinivoraceae bacterium]